MRFIDDVDTGRPPRPLKGQRPLPPRRRPPQEKAMPPRRRPGMGPQARVQVTSKDENRSGLILSSANVAGNVAITAFAGQTASQHDFLCVGIEITAHVANDAAGTVENTMFASQTSPPLIKGQSVVDGVMRLVPNKPTRVLFGKANGITQNTGLQPGNWSLTGGTAAMNWSLSVRYLTELDLRS